MFHLAENSKMRGIGYKVLNVLRPCNIIALLTVAAAGWVMVVMTGKTGQFFFFDAMAHVFSASVALFLVLTELQFGLVKTYVARSWPVFGEKHGFLWLALAMIVLGCDSLGNLNKPAFAADSIGQPLRSLILAAGILCLTFGFANLVVTAVFRDGPTRLTARMIRADGNLADSSRSFGGSAFGSSHNNGNSDDYYSTRSNSLKHYNSRPVVADPDAKESWPMAWPAAAASAASMGGAAAQRLKRMTQVFKSPFAGSSPKKMQISAPMPVESANDAGFVHHHVHHHTRDSTYGDVGSPAAYQHTADIERDAESQVTRETRDTDSDCPPDSRVSPLDPKVQRPPTALHPAMHTGRYSVAHLSQF